MVGRYVLEGYQTKNFRRASRESLSLSFIFNTFPNVTRYVLAGYPAQKFRLASCQIFRLSFIFNTFPDFKPSERNTHEPQLRVGNTYCLFFLEKKNEQPVVHDR